jgi:hypothetical protein
MMRRIEAIGQRYALLIAAALLIGLSGPPVAALSLAARPADGRYWPGWAPLPARTFAPMRRPRQSRHGLEAIGARYLAPIIAALMIVAVFGAWHAIFWLWHAMFGG